MRRRAFTLVEVITVTSILVILASLLFPVVLAAKRSAKGVSCAANLRQIDGAVRLYTVDHDDRYPYSVEALQAFNPDWIPNLPRDAPALHTTLRPLLGSPEVFHCPLDHGARYSAVTEFTEIGSSYRSQNFVRGETSTCWAEPSKTDLVADYDGGWHTSPGTPSYAGRVQVLFADGHLGSDTIFHRTGCNDPQAR